jgi:hypothetical protein
MASIVIRVVCGRSRTVVLSFQDSTSGCDAISLYARSLGVHRRNRLREKDRKSNVPDRKGYYALALRQIVGKEQHRTGRASDASGEEGGRLVDRSSRNSQTQSHKATRQQRSGNGTKLTLTLTPRSKIPRRDRRVGMPALQLCHDALGISGSTSRGRKLSHPSDDRGGRCDAMRSTGPQGRTSFRWGGAPA